MQKSKVKIEIENYKIDDKGKRTVSGKSKEQKFKCKDEI
jgi:hypothetical protein